MSGTRIAIIGADFPEKSAAVNGAADLFTKMGYEVLLDPTEAPRNSADKLLMIYTTFEPDKKGAFTDAVFFIVGETANSDLKLISEWTGHPHLRIIGERFRGDAKTDRLIREISAFLGEPEPLEIERKFLIEFPDTDLLRTLPCCQKVEISQTYLTYPDGSHARIRRRGKFDNCLYFHTLKKRISNTRRIEIEHRITEEEYLDLISDPSLSKRRIEKDRYCISYDSQYFELDVFPFWKDRAILEIELCHEDDEIRFPEWVKIIKEVTDDRSYNNSALAKDVL